MISWIDNNRNMLNIRTESTVNTNSGVEYRDISTFYVSENIYLDICLYINGSKVNPGESSFIFHSKMLESFPS